MFKTYDIIVVGGGHAGCEAAAAGAKLGSDVLMITMNRKTIGQMSCNPAMGGVAKGQILREIDALGGCSGIVTDTSTIQFRMLNRSKGPAMWSPRSQNDRWHFAKTWQWTLEKIPRLDFWQDTVEEILLNGNQVCGVKTVLGLEIKSTTVILTNGTFLNGIIHIGEKSYGGGRAGERPSGGITEQLTQLGFTSGRLKTGTSPRIDGRSLDYSKMQEQKGDENPSKFSFTENTPVQNQKSCWLVHTNEAVHDELKKGLKKSAILSGKISGNGPRYCPSVEDKIHRFPERSQHLLFVEPEGRETVEIYLNGFSSSLPEDVQYKALTKIRGFENSKLFCPGYAIEYDYFDPTQLTPSLETKRFDNLFFAGQINGTTGYEEAACQGLMAGVNAHNKTKNLEPLVLKRSEAYIGVLIDDLINKGTTEPYRMFTSRAEHRIMLRQDNADLRLTEIGYRLGLAHFTRWDALVQKKKTINELSVLLRKEKVSPSLANPYLRLANSSPIHEPTALTQLIKRPEIGIETTIKMVPFLANRLPHFSKDALEQFLIQEKYALYIEQEKKMAQKMQDLEKCKIKPDFDYNRVSSLSSEGREKLNRIRPKSIGQMSRISGVSASDVSIVLLYLGR